MSGPHARRWVLCLLLMYGILDSHSFGQRRSDSALPDRISARTLRRYAEAVALSAEQETVMAERALTYAMEYDDLMRNAEAAVAALGGDDHQSQFDVQSRFLAQLEHVDDRFFNEIESFLTQDQVAQLPRCRSERKRERYIANSRFLAGPTVVDISVLVRDMTLEEADSSRMDHLMLQYEASLMERLDHAWRAYRTLWRTPESDAVAFRQADDARLLSTCLDLTKFNHAQYPQIRAQMPAPAARQLRTRYFAAAFGAHDVADAFDGIRVAGSATLTRDENLAVQSVLDELDRETDGIVAKFIEYDLELRASHPASDLANRRSGVYAEWRSKVIECAASAREARRKAWLALHAINASIVAAPAIQDKSNEAEIVLMPSGIQKAVGVSGGLGDLFAPALLDRGAMIAWCQRLGMDENRANEIYGRYATAFEQVEAGALKTHREAYEVMLKAQGRGLTKQMADEYIAALKSSMHAVDQVDQALFNDVALTASVTNDDPRYVEGVRTRLRARFNRGTYGARWTDFGPGQRNESVIDLHALIEARLGSVGITNSLAAVLSPYEETLTYLFNRKWQAMIDYTDALWHARAEAGERAQAEGVPFHSVDLRESLEKLGGRHERLIVQINDQISALNQATLARVLPLLPPLASARLAEDYRRLAHPRVFRDELCARPTLMQALRLGDLTLDQRSRIETLTFEYDDLYRAYCDQMIASIDSIDSVRYRPEGTDTADRAEERKQARLKLAAERNDLNARTVNRLRSILNQEQVTQLGGLELPNTPKPIDFGW